MFQGLNICDFMKIKLLVLANSKKVGGRCLAGIDLKTLEWVRPVTTNTHHEIPTGNTLNLETKVHYKPLDLIEIEIVESRPLKYQRENRLCRPESITPLGSKTIQDVYSELIPKIESKPWFLIESAARIDPETYRNYKNDAPSLALIQVPRAKLSHNRYGSRRLSFKHYGIDWDLPFTDDFYGGTDSELGPSLLCLSIGEEWKPNWDQTNKTWHYKLVAGIISLPNSKPADMRIEHLSADSLLSSCNRLFDFIPEITADRQKPVRFGSRGWIYQNRVSTYCPICATPSLLIFRKHFKKFAKVMHYWGIVCSVCKNAKDSKDFTRDFVKKIDLELEQSKPIAGICETCISDAGNYKTF
jgi:hypothetical protein